MAYFEKHMELAPQALLNFVSHEAISSYRLVLPQAGCSFHPMQFFSPAKKRIFGIS
jgi:hypothetical protein